MRVGFSSQPGEPIEDVADLVLADPMFQAVVSLEGGGEAGLAQRVEGSHRRGKRHHGILAAVEDELIKAQDAGKGFDRMVVVGDVNSTMAAAIAAVKLGIPVTHVEAGLRSFDRTMPEEINRILTDSICDMLLCSEPAGVKNLKAEGHPDDQIHLVGNVMIDTLMKQVDRARKSQVLSEFGLAPGTYGVIVVPELRVRQVNREPSPLIPGKQEGEGEPARR